MLPADRAARIALDGDLVDRRPECVEQYQPALERVAVKRDPSCPVCGEHPTISEYIDYVEFCQGVRG